MKKNLSILGTLVLTNHTSINKMAQLEFFFLILILFLICSVGAIIGSYFPAQIMWIKYTKNALNCFNLKNIPFIIKEYKYKYISSFILFTLIYCITLGIFLWIWFIVTWDNYQSKNILLFIPFILIFLFTNILMMVLFKKFWNEMKKIGFYSKKEAINEFKKFQIVQKNINFKKFQVTKNNHNTIQDHPFQFQQRRFKKKIDVLNKKKINQNEYNFKLLKLFLKYLKIYSIFLNRIKSNEYNVTIENIINSENLNIFSEILISNFFAYAQQKDENI